jgi:putative endonuclease
MERYYYVYIMASKKNGTLYIGITSDLTRRIWEHKQHVILGFTSKYKVDKLVYFEEYQSVEEAIKQEKRLKEWKRKWKIELIEKKNPMWNDLFYQLTS